MDARLLKVRRRLLEDFEYYAKKALKIRTKKGKIRPLVLLPAQRKLLDTVLKQLHSEGRIRIIILKARQQGFSTFVEAFLFWLTSQRKAKKTMVLAHKADSTKALFDMTRRFYDRCPKALQPHKKYSSRNELTFDLLDSSFIVATAGGEAVARGETLSYLHASELAYWSQTSAREIWNGLIQAVADVEDTAIFVESTANGMAGLYRELWVGAVKGENGYIPFFSPWFDDPGYTAPAPEGFERTPEEEKVAARALKEYGVELTDDQLYWRRRKIAQASRELFQQEYPAYPDEAFLTSGRPVFNPEQLQEMKLAAPEPLKRMALEDGWQENPRGELLIYELPKKAGLYSIGADVGKGVRGGDNSVAQVLDEKKNHVATWCGLVLPDYFAQVLYELGMMYNGARLIVENNDHGILTVYCLDRDYAYPYLYQEIQHDKVTDKETVKLGFSTNARTKPLIIDHLRASLREAELLVRDKETIEEMLTYIVTESGKMEAEEGSHDDRVMALALANYGHLGMADPIQVKDEYYDEAT